MLNTICLLVLRTRSGCCNISCKGLFTSNIVQIFSEQFTEQLNIKVLFCQFHAWKSTALNVLVLPNTITICLTTIIGLSVGPTSISEISFKICQSDSVFFNNHACTSIKHVWLHIYVLLPTSKASSPHIFRSKSVQSLCVAFQLQKLTKLFLKFPYKSNMF